MLTQFLPQFRRGRLFLLQRNERDDCLALHFIRTTNDRSFGNTGMADKSALNLRGTKSMSRYIQDVINPANYPEIAIFIPTRPISREIAVLNFTPIYFFVSRFISPDCSQHRG